MLRSAPNKVKHGARSCLGIGDVFLITKESDSKTVEKYKNMAVSEKARADENAEEIHELREMLNGARGGSAELAELKRALDDRTDKLREAEEARRASQAAAQAAIEESLQDAASLREQLAKAEEEREAERKRAKLAAEQLAEEQASKAAVASGSEAAGAMVAKLQAELSRAQVDQSVSHSHTPTNGAHRPHVCTLALECVRCAIVAGRPERGEAAHRGSGQPAQPDEGQAGGGVGGARGVARPR